MKKSIASLFSLAGIKAAFAAPAAAVVVTDFTGTLANQQSAVLAVVAASFVLLGIVVGVKYIRRAAK